MSANKERLTITLDPRLLEAGHNAVEAGDAASISSWINDAVETKVSRDQKLANLAAAVGDFEAEFGQITDEEIATQQRLDRAQATVVRGNTKSA